MDYEKSFILINAVFVFKYRVSCLYLLSKQMGVRMCFLFLLSASGKMTLCLDWVSDRISDLFFCLFPPHALLHTYLPNISASNWNTAFSFPRHLPPCEASLICSPLLWVRGLQAAMVSDEASVLRGTQQNGGAWSLMQLLLGCAKFHWKRRGAVMTAQGTAEARLEDG